MSYHVNLPFKKGETLYGATVGGSVPSSGANYNFIGQEYTYDDPTTHAQVVLRAVKNESGIALYGQQPVVLNSAGTKILGYARLPDSRWVVLDDSLPSTGVAANDVCFVVVRGPCTVKTAGANLLAIVDGDMIVAATAANSTAAGTTAAGVNKIGALAAATDASTINNGVMARAISAATTNNTQTGIRVRMDARLI